LFNVKRRQAIRSILAWPAVAALPAAGQQQQSAQSQPSAAPADQPSELPVTATDEVALPSLQFFSPAELATLRHLCEILVPTFAGRPGAAEAGAAEFLDFLISQSAEARRTLYRAGIAHLDSESRRLHGKPFAQIDARQADPWLAPLREPWSYEGPADPFARFLLAAKEDALRATVNSREWAAVAAGRRGSGVGFYWRALD
jgi:hypothetical protein